MLHNNNFVQFLFLGGMLLVSLDTTDLQSEKMAKFDGTLIYSQNKRQQIVMTERWAEQYPNIYFASMHPGILSLI